MDQGQFQEFLKANEEATDRAIEKYVNGGIREMKKGLADHAKEDGEFQRRAEPMLKLFEDNNIVKMKMKGAENIIIFYVKNALSVGGLIIMLWGLVKFVTNRT